MPRFTMTLVGGKEAIEAIRQLDIDVQAAKGTALMAGGEVIRGSAARRAPYKTGNLRRSITVSEPEGSASGAVWVTIGTNLVYAAIHEFGGTITAKTALMLHWVDDDGQHHFAREVHIPARPYLRPAFDEDKEYAVVAMGIVLRKIIEAAAA